jgi:RNA-directed DNA polymerase
MEKRMKEPYTEGVAIHGDPESCVGVCEGVGEALTGARAGWAIEPRNQGSGVPTPLTRPEGNIAASAIRELVVDPARSENLCMCGIFMRENREVPRLARPADHGAGRSGKVEAAILR